MIGAVDGSLIKAPHDQEHLYMCDKRFHAINTMAVCNAQLSFTNCVSKKNMKSAIKILVLITTIDRILSMQLAG